MSGSTAPTPTATGCTIGVPADCTALYPSLTTVFDWWIFAALLIPLILAAVAAWRIGWYVLGNADRMEKVVDKLTQLLSEGDTSKMSLSRVQAFLFTYVITFGCLLIIVRTGQFPPAIPDDLAILAGGSLGTFVVSKAIQGSTNQGPTSQSAPKPPQQQQPVQQQPQQEQPQKEI